MATTQPHKLAIVLLLLFCTFAAVFKLGYVGTTYNSDYVSYVTTAQLFAGQDVQAYPQRILKPLAPLFVTVVASVSSYPTAFLFEVLIFYFAFALVLYWLGWLFFEDRWLAVIVALLGALSYPMLRYGVDLYTETGAQFFYVLSLALTLLYIKVPSRKLLIANGLALGIGLLWKEYSAVAGLVFGLVLLFEEVSWRTRVANLALLALVSLAPTLLVQIWTYIAYHYTYLNWYVAGGASGFATQFTLHNLIKSTGALLGLAWLLVPFGLWKFPELSSVNRRFLYVAIPPSFIALAWGYVSSRLFFVMAPAFILLAVLGLARSPRYLQVIAVALILIANIAWLVIAAT